ncbi:MAG TPA: PBP1A family penicillin-binding protein [Longimicrobiales bacterium]|nr:PBP1A family penicillin-binding protein [Longimicrobiales bacterium]
MTNRGTYIGGAAATRLRRLRGWLAARPRLMAGLGIGVIALCSLLAGLFIGAWQTVCRDCPSIAQIHVWEPKQATKILDHDGKLIAELFEERRTPVEIGTLPRHVPQAFVAIEDKRFYRHEGLDYRRLISANIRNVLSRRITGGGSTITQQLARNMFEDRIGFEQVITRKLKEAKVAKQLEQVYTKDEILQAYINQVNYGHGWRGIETASQHYFGKPAIDLNPAEGAMLAAAVNAPGRYSPFINHDATLRRRNTVLALMAAQGYLTAADKERWQQEPLPQQRHGTEVGRIAPYFVEWVRTTLESRYGLSLYSAGLRVYTTLDLEMQRYAEAAMDSGWARIDRDRAFRGPTYAATMANRERRATPESPYLQGMLIALDPATGEVRALVGGRDFNDSKFNRATQALRQPGSTFKPFVYYAALNSGVPASTVLYDAPLNIDMPDGTVYAPRNYDPDYFGPVLMRDALKFSINTVTVKLGIDVGLETVAQAAREFGLRTPILAVPSMPIGSPDVMPIQLAEAYTVFANGGMRARARPILRVEDAGGRVLWETRPENEQVGNPAAVAITRDFMQTVLNNGTGYPARDPAQGNLPYSVPGAGKTGTTNESTDVWFAGFTPNLLAVVWYGFDRPRRIMPGAAGGRLAAPVWGRFMRDVYVGDGAQLETPAPWQWPAGVVGHQIDRESGRLANEYCSANTVIEYFVAGSEPGEACSPMRGGLFGAPLRPDTMTMDTLRVPRPQPTARR